MNRPSLDAGVLRKVTALVPLLCLSGAWTVSLAVSSAEATSEAEQPVQLPAETIEAPASWSHPRAAATSRWSRTRTGPAASTDAIPLVALAAYQRAAQIMDDADRSCHVPWTLLAAIGHVESDHGRYGGSLLSSDGVSSPGIYGIPLTGANGTQRITDTDAGLYDGDGRFDRAVGPMQFIPSTWSVVGVDGDGDKRRNPQDIDDAALAAAVYLCSGPEDLSTSRGVDDAVFRYNHSREYVALVKSVAAEYAAGNFAAAPTGSYSAVFLDKVRDDSIRALGAAGHDSAESAPPKPEDSRPAAPTGPSPAPASPPKTEEPKADPVKQLLPEVVEDTVDGGLAAIKDVLDGVSSLVAGLLPPKP